MRTEAFHGLLERAPLDQLIEQEHGGKDAGIRKWRTLRRHVSPSARCQESLRQFGAPGFTPRSNDHIPRKAREFAHIRRTAATVERLESFHLGRELGQHDAALISVARKHNERSSGLAAQRRDQLARLTDA